MQPELGLRRVASDLTWTDDKTILFLTEASMTNSRLFFFIKQSFKAILIDFKQISK